MKLGELRRGKPHRRALPLFGEEVTAMMLGKKFKNQYSTFEVIVIDPRNGAQKASAGQIKQHWTRVPQRDLLDAPKPRAPEVESRGVYNCHKWNCESMCILKGALAAQQPRQKQRRRATAMLADNVPK